MQNLLEMQATLGFIPGLMILNKADAPKHAMTSLLHGGRHWRGSVIWAVSRIKNGVTFLPILVQVCVCLGCSHRLTEHHSSTAAATVIVERSENDGSLNTVRCAIVFSTGQRVELGGGETTTVTVPAGSLWVEALSIHPYSYSENPDPKAWTLTSHKAALESRRSSAALGRTPIERQHIRRWLDHRPKG
jgi:hypothetical protein